MRVQLAIAVGLLLDLATAKKFSTPIHLEKRNSPARWNRPSEDGGDHKVPRSGPKQHVISRPWGIREGPARPHSPSQYYFYTTNLSIGTPPQSFRAIVDLDSADLFVPSINCGGHRCAEKAKYDSNASSTYHENGTPVRKTYGSVFAYGRLSSDVITLGEAHGALQVSNHDFMELNYYEIVFPDDDLEYFDSVLGLAYDKPALERDPQTPSTLKSPFRSIVEQDVLDENIISVLIPRNETHVGDLMFGGYNETILNGESLVSHPMFPSNTTSWQLEVSALVVDSSKKDIGNIDKSPLLFNETLPQNMAALIHSAFPGLAFPHPLGGNILAQIPTKQSPCTYQQVVDCNNMASLPSITITFPNQHQNIVLTAEQYTMRFVDENPRFCGHPVDECWVMITEIPRRIDFFPSNVMILGSSFLRSVYAVFDWDKRTISREPQSFPRPSSPIHVLLPVFVKFN